jgi:hypothetical protein
MPAPNRTSMMKSHSPKGYCPLSRVASILVTKTKQEEYQLVMWVRLGHFEGRVRWLVCVVGVIIRKIWIGNPGRPLKSSDARNRHPLNESMIGTYQLLLQMPGFYGNVDNPPVQFCRRGISWVCIFE